ncbi:hypothetical protein THAOC_28606 [Thalassiosira oceanica]|uniref:Uncharacterized protein n=1 Tax=Thalassiosira oceanica TaxID=159749 RepID=K0RTF1_THAOC|nr:hypothetical protein THAOC_28606 [Thalassiosira oceanica]|eukprot:EJK52156.1 hypothetical protein THAOC_28606 [Thalassiosira oceanica]
MVWNGPTTFPVPSPTISGANLLVVQFLGLEKRSSLAQLVERETVNLEAVSSILTGRELYFIDRAIFHLLV